MHLTDSAAVIGAPSMTMDDILEDIHRELDLCMRHRRLVLTNGITTNDQNQNGNDQDKKGDMETKAAGLVTSVQQQQQQSVFVPTSDIVHLEQHALK